MNVDLQTNVATIEPAPDRELDLSAVPRRIREIGLRPGKMWLRAEGRFVAHDGGQGFRIAGWPSVLRIAAGHGPTPEGTAVLRARVSVEEGRVTIVPDDDQSPQ